MYVGSHMVSAQAHYPVNAWISSSAITRLAEQVWPLISPLLPLNPCNFFSSSPYLISFPPSPPNSFSPVPSHTLPLAFVSSSPSLSLASFPSDFFSYCSSSHTPSCCSKSLKGTDLVGAVAVVIEALAIPAGLWHTEWLHQNSAGTGLQISSDQALRLGSYD